MIKLLYHDQMLSDYYEIRLDFERECNHNKVFYKFLTTIFIKFDWVHSHPVDFWAVRAFVNFKQVLYISKTHKMFELSGIIARAVSVSGFIKLRQYYIPMTRRLQILDGLCMLHSTHNFRKHKLNILRWKNSFECARWYIL